MISRIIKGVVIGSTIGAVVAAAEVGMSKNVIKMGKKFIKSIGL